MTDLILRIHPTINFARVGNSEDYYLAPETAAGELVDTETGLFGGLLVKPGTDGDPITADDLRDGNDSLKRQAARFRIYAYDGPQDSYPSGGGVEVCIGSKINGKTVTDIRWTVHLANKKANNFKIAFPFQGEDTEPGIAGYEDGNLPPLRNEEFGTDASSKQRLTDLVIDAGPRALSVVNDAGKIQRFDEQTTPSWVNDQGQIETAADYPKSFPGQHFKMFDPQGAITTLGDMDVESDTGRLVVRGGYGRASAIVRQDGSLPSLNGALDNDFWFDDTSDGPVDALVVFDDGSTMQAVGGWFVCTDPGYAPQIRNAVSTWDDVFTTWVEELNLMPNLYSNGAFNPDYTAHFYQDVQPVFHAAFLQRWNTDLPGQGIAGHDFVASIQPSDDPTKKIPDFDSLIRDPNSEDDVGKKMPLALGDAMKSFLSLAPAQYFLLKQWHLGKSTDENLPEGPGETLDRAVLQNCLGGRYSPGIDLTFIVRDVNLYKQDWKGANGPFRINAQPLNYTYAQASEPFLGEGYIPLRTAQVQPGDLCKFMALPWHCDYNSCATHEPDPNPAGNNTLYWSWPAQRPVQVYPADLCSYDDATGSWTVSVQRYSVRGDEGHGTESSYPQQQGRYQCYFDFVENWHKVGFVIQGSRIPAPQGENYGREKFLEAKSLFSTAADASDPVVPWPQAVIPGYQAPEDCGP